jgi:hypothetical protein
MQHLLFFIRVSTILKQLADMAVLSCSECKPVPILQQKIARSEHLLLPMNNTRRYGAALRELLSSGEVKREDIIVQTKVGASKSAKAFRTFFFFFLLFNVCRGLIECVFVCVFVCVCACACACACVCVSVQVPP